jgi:hypothetical protein
MKTRSKRKSDRADNLPHSQPESLSQRANQASDSDPRVFGRCARLTGPTEELRPKRNMSMTVKRSLMRKIARDALNLFDPTACMEPTHEQNIQEITDMLEALNRTNPEFAAQLDPTTLSGVLAQTQNGKTLEQALEEICVCT